MRYSWFALSALLFLPLLGCNPREPQRERDTKEPTREKPAATPPAKKQSSYQERLDSLKEAVGKGRVSEVKEQLKNGADVNDKDDDGQTPLMWAAAKGHRAMVWLLFSVGAIPGERDNQGRNALMH